MLDQNTDRMWYVIGAVIVGAAIIFLANGTLPNLFASVTESFSEQSIASTSHIDSIGMVQTNLLYSVEREYGLWLYADGSSYYELDRSFTTDKIAVSPGGTYLMSMSGQFEDFIGNSTERYASARLVEYDADGRFLKATANLSERTKRVTLLPQTHHVRYSGKTERRGVPRGLNGHGLAKVVE